MYVNLTNFKITITWHEGYCNFMIIITIITDMSQKYL